MMQRCAGYHVHRMHCDQGCTARHPELSRGSKPVGTVGWMVDRAVLPGLKSLLPSAIALQRDAILPKQSEREITAENLKRPTTDRNAGLKIDEQHRTNGWHLGSSQSTTNTAATEAANQHTPAELPEYAQQIQSFRNIFWVAIREN